MGWWNSVKNSYKFFRNVDCEMFPCHSVKNSENFNCIFCYCPLYTKENCGGNYSYTSSGLKDCTKCTVPHDEKNYDYIIKKL